MKLDTDFEIRKVALEREENRAQRIGEAFQGLPSRKTGELSIICDIVKRAHKTLCFYDLMPDPPAMSDITETWFDAGLARIADLKEAAKKD